MTDAYNEHHYAVVVGVQRYPGLRDLHHARQDAENVVTWLRSRDGGNLPRDNVIDVLADPAHEPDFTVATAMPRQADVDHALGRVNKAIGAAVAADPSAWETSRLYLYASGHGIAPGQGTAAVLMADVDADPDVMAYGRNIELSLYQTWYRECGLFREVLLLADCCRDRDFTAPGNGPPWVRCIDPYAAANFALGLATTYGAPAFEPTEDDDGHGYFTQALIDGLRGGAADPTTGEVDTTNLGEYVRRAVRVLSEGKRYPQRPSVLADTADPIVLRPGRGPLPPLRRTVTIAFPEGYSERVQLVADRRPTGDEHDPARGPWTIELDEGLYQVRPVGGGSAPFADAGILYVYAKDRDVHL